MRRLFPNNTFVAPQMPNPAKDLVRLVVAEAPGEEEALRGGPLVGGSGKWFDSLMSQAGVDRAGLTITNCIQCRPPNNVFPTDPDAKKYISRAEGEKAVAHCQAAHVRPLIKSRKWKRIDLLGEKALSIVAGKNEGIFKWRGSPITVPDCGDKPIAIPTLHPSYIMRDQTYFPVTVNDLLKGLEPPPEYYTPFPDIDDVRNFTFDTFAFDIETNRFTNEIICVGLCARPYFALTVPFKGAYIPELKRIFAQAKVAVGHNCLQFDLPRLQKAGVPLSKTAVVYDTMLLQHLCFPDFPHDLEFVGSQFCNKPAWKHEKGVLQIYCCRDTDVTLQCYQQLVPLVKQHKLMELYLDVQVPLAKICLLMQETGFKINPNRIMEVREKLLAECIELEKQLPESLRSQDVAVRRRVEAPAGSVGKSGKPIKFLLVPATERVIPWRSTEVKRRYLYTSEPGSLGLEPILDPKSGKVTTGKIALAKIVTRFKREGRPEIKAIQALGKLNKLDELITTFATEDMVKVDRVHPHFNVHGTASGRLSSSDPNLQNVPESTRVMYVPSHDGWKIVDVDFSNIENRLTACLAGDTERLRRYDDPKYSDYKQLASRAFGIPYDEVVKDNDREAPYGKCKAIVLGTNYGLGERKIVNMYDMDPREVRKLMSTWRQEIKQTTLWQGRITDQARKDGLLTTPFARKRWFYTSSLYTEALSFLPQSCAADIIFRAMIGIMYERIGLSEAQAKRVVRTLVPLPAPARLLLQVHDSLVFECPPDLVDKVVTGVRAVMEQPWPELGGFYIPISIKVGDSWGEAEDYKLPPQTKAATAASN